MPEKAKSGEVKVVAGFDPGSTAAKAFDGQKVVLFESVMGPAGSEDAEIDALKTKEELQRTELGSLSFSCQRQAGGLPYWVGSRAYASLSPRFLADDRKDSQSVALYLDCALVALAPQASVIHASVVTNIPIEEYLAGSSERIKERLSGERSRVIDGRAVTFRVECLEVLPEAVPVLFYLNAEGELEEASAYLVIDAGGRSLDLAYYRRRDGKLIRELSKHFNEGHDVFVVGYIERWLRRRVNGVDRGRIRRAMAERTYEYETPDGQTINFKGQIPDAQEEYVAASMGRITELWRDEAASRVVISGGGAIPTFVQAVKELYPQARMIPPRIARTAGAIGLYHRAKMILDKRAKALPANA